MPDPVIKLLESPEDMTLVEDLQRAVWPGSETDVVPAHLLITVPRVDGVRVVNRDGNVTALTFQNISGNFVLVKGTVGATAPTTLPTNVRFSRSTSRCWWRNSSVSQIADLWPNVIGSACNAKVRPVIGVPRCRSLSS